MDLEKIRSIRSNPSVKLKPSPFLKDKYVDEYGAERSVVIRNYQGQGILNLLMVTRMICGDDTGLGKTLETLNAIGYVWLVEPEYVPIVIAKKSALYQWADETSKFMKDMEAVIVDGEPYERAEVYKDFFGGHDPDKKRLLLMTYDTVLKDSEQSVVRDRSRKPTKEEKAELRAAKASLEDAKAALAAEKSLFEAHFCSRSFTEYLQEVLKPSDPDAPVPPPPAGWSPPDAERLSAAVAAREAVRRAQLRVGRAKDAVEPPVVTDGVLAHMDELVARSPGTKFMLIFDEMHMLKNYQGKIHKACADMARRSNRVIGLTATPVKNRLMEFFGLFRIINSSLFPKVTHFHRDYCIVKLQPIGGGRKVPVVIGHKKEQLDAFVKAVEPYYLSRKKHEVAKELPELITREIVCVLSQEQEELYDLAEVGLLDEGDNPDSNPADMLRAMTMVQQACNAPQLLMDEDGNPFEGDSSKMEALVDVLEENPDMKTIVFSRFEKMISLIESRLKKEKIGCVRITGKENDPKKRQESARRFQDQASGVNVMLITTAGSESLNLQAAGHIVFVDSPFSWGDYIQLTGRAVRIGSTHMTVLCTHLVARRHGGGKTIDDHVIKILRSKKKLADKVAGENLKGGLEFTEEDAVTEILGMISAARGAGEDVRSKVATLRASKVRSTSKRKQPAAKGAEAKEPAYAPAAYVDLDVSDI